MQITMQPISLTLAVNQMSASLCFVLHLKRMLATLPGPLVPVMCRRLMCFVPETMGLSLDLPGQRLCNAGGGG